MVPYLSTFNYGYYFKYWLFKSDAFFFPCEKQEK